MSDGDRLFLDANVLFSAARRGDSGLRRFWEADVSLLSSTYAVEEARRNLPDDSRLDALEHLLEKVEISGRGIVVIEDGEVEERISSSGLPEKDIPILRAAVESRATHLITGDRKHFGHLYGESVAGVAVVSARNYLDDF